MRDGVVIHEHDHVAFLDGYRALGEHLAFLSDRAFRRECDDRPADKCNHKCWNHRFHGWLSVRMAKLEPSHRGRTGTMAGSLSLVMDFMNATRSSFSCFVRPSALICSDRLGRLIPPLLQ